MKLIAAMLAVALLLAGCVNRQYRKTEEVCSADANDAAKCGDATYIKLPSSKDAASAEIAFIEFDKEGELFNTPTALRTLEGIKAANQAAGPNGVLLVVFIHGWNHNAHPGDGNVKQFQDFLQAVASDEATLAGAQQGSAVGNPRKVVGVYFGWQGYAANNRLARLLSFRNKKELSLRTGAPGVREILHQLADIRGSNPSNRLVTIGHSFGGGVLFTAIRDELLLDVSNGRNRGAPYNAPYGDLALLLNPAVEAGRFAELEQLQQACVAQESGLRLASFTSEGDKDLSGSFPLGMKLFYLFRLGRYGSSDLMTTPFGLYDQWVQYRLGQTEAQKALLPLDPAQFGITARQWSSFRSGTSSLTFPGVEMTRALPTESPLLKWPAAINVTVDRNLIGDHNDIWQPSFKNFMRYFIGMRFSRYAKSELPNQRRDCGSPLTQ